MGTDAAEQRRRDVFISYAWNDRAVASSLAAALQDAGLRVWWDAHQLQSGGRWAEQIEEGIRSADILLVLVSQQMLQSEWALRELRLPSFTSALEDRAITVIPILLEDCNLPPALAGRVWLDMRGDRGEAIRHLVSQLKAAPWVDLARLAPADLERLVADLLVGVGFRDVRLVGSGPQTNYDIEATVEERDPFGSVSTRRWLVEVKHTRNERITIASLKRFLDRLAGEPPSTGAALVTSVRLTSVARDFISAEGTRSGREVRVVEEPQLTALVLSQPGVAAKYFPEPER